MSTLERVLGGPEIEVVAKATRRRVTLEYKRKIVREADRGPAMTSKPVAFLLADLGVTQTRARPHVSNDNPFSEAQFKTLKYRRAFPARFGSIQDARAHCHVFFPWYNTEPHHSGLGLLTPHDVHYGLAAARRERFPHGVPTPAPLPATVWINEPNPTTSMSVDGVVRASCS
jgi:putative transposase